METNNSAVTLCRKPLAEALRLLSMVAPKKSSVPIITHLKMVSQNGDLMLAATDLEMGVIARLPRKGEAFLQAVVPAAPFARSLCLSGGDDVSLAAMDGHGITMDEKATFVGLDPVDFPAIPENMGVPIAVLKAAELAEAINTVEYAISDEVVRYALTGMLLDLQAKTAVAAASDGKRLAVHALHRSKRSGRCRVIVPAKAARTLARLCDLAGPETTVEVSVEYVDGADGAPREPKTIHFLVGAFRLYTRPVDGDFPDVRSVIPDHKSEGWTFDRKALAEALKAVRQATTDRTRAVRFRIKDARCELFARTHDVGEARAEASIQGVGETETVLNPDYVLQYLASLPKSVVAVTLKADGPKLATSWHGLEGHTYVLMPLTVNLNAPK